ncbi:hypothetical protein [Histidinibacterium aquaticum]|uniref:Uncharacterized protein n=1 Tax=Histidinibacterium aquaticum TaxID=2613962 RepID=A0A5J5GR81_9RHOB|nr:hypothetical protein [Histidinibacterium aquaticum]KAA9010014.1 hypothetical protein F3S47_01795 [Histidinibacterium aquaticum]
MPTGQLSGTIDGQAVDVKLDCSSWDAEQQMVYSLGDDRGQSDTSGDGVIFRFSHFAPAGMTDASVSINGETFQVGPAFRAEDDTEWSVEDDIATFDGPSGAAEDRPVSLTLDCAPRSPEEDGYVGRVTGVVDGIEIDAPLSCATWEDREATQERTPPDTGNEVELFVIRQSGHGTVTVSTETETYQMVATGDAFVISPDTIAFESSYRRSDDTTYDAALTFDCSQRTSSREAVPITELPPMPEALTAGQNFAFSLADIPGSAGDMIVITDGNPGWLFTAMRDGDGDGDGDGDDVTLTAPETPGAYVVEYLGGPDMTPTARMEILVE